MPYFPITHVSVRVTVRKMVFNLMFEVLFRDSYDMYINARICNCYKLYGNVNIADVSSSVSEYRNVLQNVTASYRLIKVSLSINCEILWKLF